MQMCFNLGGGNEAVVKAFDPSTAVEHHSNEGNIVLWNIMSESEINRVKELHELIMVHLIQPSLVGMKKDSYYGEYMQDITVEGLVRHFKLLTKALAEFYLVVDEVPLQDEFKTISELNGNSREDLKYALEAIYNSATEMLVALTGTNETIVACLVRDERKVQFDMWGHQQHPVNTWSLILTEELGEVSQAIQQLVTNSSKSTDKSDIIHETIQVAAIAHAILEQLGGDIVWTSLNL